MADSELVYLNGELVPYGEAKISVEDRGFNFADGIYEMVRIVGGRPFRVEDHLDRFTGGARALEIDLPLAREGVREAILEVTRANDIEEGTVYVQLTRGAAPRGHAFPKGVKPTLVMLARPHPGQAAERLERGVAVVTAPDLRWGYCEVKTIGLLPNVIAYQHARTVYTHPIDNLLPAITRRHAIEGFRENGVEVKEVGVPVDEFRAADEIFLTGTTTEVMGVVSIDGEVVGDGKPGKLTRLGQKLYRRALDSARAGE
jgi:D-alanine transaminase